MLKLFLLLSLLSSATSAGFPDWGDSVLLAVVMTSLFLGVALNNLPIIILPALAVLAEVFLTYFQSPQELRALLAGFLVMAEAFYLFR